MARPSLGAGDLSNRIEFQRRGADSDGFGNALPGGAFETQFTVWANLRPLRGSETVIAGRLAGQQPYVITVRASPTTRQIDESWRAVDASNPDRVFAITAPPSDPDGSRACLEMMTIQGKRS